MHVKNTIYCNIYYYNPFITDEWSSTKIKTTMAALILGQLIFTGKNTAQKYFIIIVKSND